MPTVVFLTAGSTQTPSVPADYDSAANTWHVIGAGSRGGGAYASVSNLVLTPGGTFSYFIAAGVTEATAADTWISSTAVAPTSTSEGALAKGGTNTAGGLASTSIGTAKNNGGTPGTGTGNGGGGGGAGGPNGAGGNGGSSSASNPGGGGGANSGENGNTDGSRQGGDNRSGTGGGTPGTDDTSGPIDDSTDGGDGSDGGGGGGAGYFSDKGTITITHNGGDGSMEIIWTDDSGGANNGVQVGPGGGGGGTLNGTTTDGDGGAGGNYGGGGGDDGNGSGVAGAGRNGVIVLTYSRLAAATVRTSVAGIIG